MASATLEAAGRRDPPLAPPWPPSRAAAIALLAGVAVTAALALLCLSVYHHNERRLLHLRLRELNLVLAANAPTLQTPLASAAELANATRGNPQKFREFMGPYVGKGRQFASASLWRLGPGPPRPRVIVGVRPVLLSAPQHAARFLARDKRAGVLDLTGVMGTAHPTLGFEVRASAATPSFAVYAENPLPADRRSSIESNSAFSDLSYALYIGHSQRGADLLVTNASKLPLRGTHASEVVPFGTAAFRLVVAPKGTLGGTFFRSLPWIIAVAGVLMSLAAALLTDRLSRRRERAERLARVLDRVAAENREMYREQRSISQTLQHALLPERMPELQGASASARYVPAGAGVDVGGDWYDVVPLDDGRVFMIIGDVSGHGLRAATTMALLRHAALAYAAESPEPGGVLSKLARFVGADHDYFATVLCALLDIEGHGLTAASAGHMAPLVIDEAGAEYVAVTPGPALGVTGDPHSRYPPARVSVRPSATVLAFTDGLVERRGEVLDVGLARLRNLALQQRLGLDELLATLARKLTSEDHTDDTAIVGIQWQS